MQSANGHQYLIDNAQDIDQLIESDRYDAQVRDRLSLVVSAREFASDRLSLEANGSYTQYVSLDRSYVVRNLFAAEEFSTELYTWCYPVVGCTKYRGYFDEQMLAEYQRELDEQGYDTYIADVPAYSTLGWFDDPVLSTFIDWQEYRLVGLIFHELAHQQLYIDDDTIFNESFATAVAQAGLILWFSGNKDQEQLLEYFDEKKRKVELYRLVETSLQALDDIYHQDISDDEKRKQKAVVLKQLRDRYDTNSVTWNNLVLNNASLGMMTAYNRYVPSFLAMLEHHENDFQRFYTYASEISKLQSVRREQCLLDWSTIPANIERIDNTCAATSDAVAMTFQ